MSELGKQIKKCGWCGEEIKDGKYFTVWKKDKLVMIFCKKCYFERKDLTEHLRNMLGCMHARIEPPTPF